MKHGLALREDSKSTATVPCPATHAADCDTLDSSSRWEAGKRLLLVSTYAHHFNDGTQQRIHTNFEKLLDKTVDILIVGDTIRGPPKLFIFAEEHKVDPSGRVQVTVSCNKTPWFLPKGQVVAQAIILPENRPRHHRTPSIWWAEIVGQDKPTLNCKLCNGKSPATLTGMVDTGADITIISNASPHPQCSPISGSLPS